MLLLAAGDDDTGFSSEDAGVLLGFAGTEETACGFFEAVPEEGLPEVSPVDGLLLTPPTDGFAEVEEFAGVLGFEEAAGSSFSEELDSLELSKGAESLVISEFSSPLVSSFFAQAAKHKTIARTNVKASIFFIISPFPAFLYNIIIPQVGKNLLLKLDRNIRNFYPLNKKHTEKRFNFVYYDYKLALFAAYGDSIIITHFVARCNHIYSNLLCELVGFRIVRAFAAPRLDANVSSFGHRPKTESFIVSESNRYGIIHILIYEGY